MFTGVVEGTGRVVAREPHEGGLRFRVACDFAGELAPGESVAVSGVCQTVTAADGESFAFESIRTTLSRTTLGDLAGGERVNLERALRAGDRLGGHLVQGHVDAVGMLAAREPAGETWLLRIELPDEVAECTVEHGSLAVDGVSLTVNRLEGAVAEVAIIPYTWSHTTLSEVRPGGRVNLEGDLVGKYVRRLLAPYGPGLPDEGRRPAPPGRERDAGASHTES
ncbi:MAG TPA: riboflavin synthase [Gemmatimonadota bacterium]|nr:riboflavin synthase [Gemmatimonadota bacterium]